MIFDAIPFDFFLPLKNAFESNLEIQGQQSRKLKIIARRCKDLLLDNHQIKTDFLPFAPQVQLSVFEIDISKEQSIL